MDDELASFARWRLGPATRGFRGAGLAGDVLRFAASCAAMDREVLAVAERFLAADADSGWARDPIGWLTVAGSRWATADAANAAFDRALRDLHRTELSRAGLSTSGTGDALRFEVRNGVRVLSDTGHYKKVVESIRRLERIERSRQLGPDRQMRLAEELADLRSAKLEAEAVAREAGKSPASLLSDAPRIEHVREVVPAATETSAGTAAGIITSAIRAAGNTLFSPFVVLAPTSVLPTRKDRIDDLA
jgi:hypothetical protein